MGASLPALLPSLTLRTSNKQNQSQAFSGRRLPSPPCHNDQRAIAVPPLGFFYRTGSGSKKEYRKMRKRSDVAV